MRYSRICCTGGLFPLELFCSSHFICLSDHGTSAAFILQVMAGNGYTSACDIWSLGVMMYIMLCGYLPFNGNNITELFDSVRANSLKACTQDRKDFGLPNRFRGALYPFQQKNGISSHRKRSSASECVMPGLWTEPCML
eukprot:SAG31_NODE_4073_length_3614_cov_3.849218_3_plen_139_part_00